MTLKSFLSSKEILYIHCKNEHQAKELCKSLNKLGATWKSGEKYTEDSYYYVYKGNSCYGNKGIVVDKNTFKFKDNLLDFNEVALW